VFIRDTNKLQEIREENLIPTYLSISSREWDGKIDSRDEPIESKSQE
jgi:hypothetical protein